MRAIPTNDPNKFFKAVETLTSYSDTGRTLRTQNFSVAVAILMLRKPLSGFGRPHIARKLWYPDSGPTIGTSDLQHAVCDAIYSKRGRFLPEAAQGPIYKPFTSSFKPATNNNWRNSFDLQAGLSCDAPFAAEFLKSPNYLAESRLDCPYRNADTAKCSSPAGLADEDRTCFNPNKKGAPPGPKSVAAITPKLLTRGRDGGGNHGYWVIEPTAEVLADLIKDPAQRVPLFPLICALYSGSTFLNPEERLISAGQFQEDLDLDDIRFLTLFDPDPHSASNEFFLREISALSTSIPASPRRAEAREGAQEDSQPSEGARTLSTRKFKRGRGIKDFESRAANAPDPAERLLALEKASRGHARTMDELSAVLEARGISAIEQPAGFDLFCKHKEVGHLFEIKTWRPENIKSQARAALAQLLEYRWKNRDLLPKETRLYVVWDRKPPAELWIWDFMYSEFGIVPCWIEGEVLQAAPSYAAAVEWLL